MAGLEALWFTLGLVGAFLSGSVPYSVIIGRLATGKDLRKYNIGNPGGFNAVITYGIPIGLTVMFVDILKGFVPFMALDLIFRNTTTMGPHTIWYKLIMILGPALCILGHNHSPWLGFKGGRGSAVFIGTLLWMNPLPLLPDTKILLFCLTTKNPVGTVKQYIYSPSLILTAISAPLDSANKIHTGLSREPHSIFGK